MRFLEQSPTLDQALLLASEGFGIEITPQMAESVRLNLLASEIHVVAVVHHQVIGCMLATIPLPGVLHITGTLILPAYQGMGIKRDATQHLLTSRPELQWIMGRTQSSHVWSSVRNMAKELLPSPENVVVSDELRAMQARLFETFGQTSEIEKGRYGKPLHGSKPIHRDPQLQTWWDSICNFEAGDAILYLARV